MRRISICCFLLGKIFILEIKKSELISTVFQTRIRWDANDRSRKFFRIKLIPLMENWLLFAVFCYTIRFESLDFSSSNLERIYQERTSRSKRQNFWILGNIRGRSSIKFSDKRAARFLFLRKFFPGAFINWCSDRN
mgnify:CR=1 FL=1